MQLHNKSCSFEDTLMINIIYDKEIILKYALRENTYFIYIYIFPRFLHDIVYMITIDIEIIIAYTEA